MVTYKKDLIIVIYNLLIIYKTVYITEFIDLIYKRFKISKIYTFAL